MKRFFKKATVFACLLMGAVLIVFAGHQIWQRYDAARKGLIFPDSFRFDRVLSFTGQGAKFKNLYPDLAWSKGITFAPYQPIIYQGRCPVYGSFCNGTDIEWATPILLIDAKDQIVAAFTVEGLENPCRQKGMNRLKEFTRSDPTACK